jgi:hypothetical protein
MSIEKRYKVHNLIILDESGSMMSIKKSIISGFNELVQTVKGIEKEYPEQEHFISLVTFNGLGQKTLHFADPVRNLEMIDDSRYKPDSLTPLYDAMGFSFAKLSKFLENETDYHVLVTVLTDGEENDSKEFNGQAIKKQIEELKQNSWTFTYIGTDHDVESFAISISIDNTLRFSKTEEGLKAMFSMEKDARANYSRKIRENRDTSGGFYEEDEKQKQKQKHNK